MRTKQVSMFVLAAALGIAGAARGDSLAPTRDQGSRPLTAAGSSGGTTAGQGGATVLGAPKSKKADLVILPFYNNPSGLPEGFPTESYCVKKPSGGAPNQIKFYVRNQGGAPSGNFTWVPTFPQAGAAPANVLVSIAPGAQVLVTHGLPDGCYTPGFSGNCPFSIKLDTLNEVSESNEGNNQQNSFCVSPAG
jgi:hypothetical protein